MKARLAGRPRSSPPGVMFHHFHGPRHASGQGSISASDLEAVIHGIGRENILDARDWEELALAGRLPRRARCLTFDDNLRSQFDLAYPVLSRHRIRAFWFVSTSTLDGRVIKQELYRHFRTTAFGSLDDFYDAFEEAVQRSPFRAAVAEALARTDPNEYLPEFAFYSDRDRRFRFIRDKPLGPSRYEAVMDAMLRLHRVKARDLARKLWMDARCLKELSAAGHSVGLHSHTHPNFIHELPAGRQRLEYATNVRRLTDLLGVRPTSMAHPRNSYDGITLKILADLGVRLGFRSNCAPVPDRSMLELPREDHTDVLNALRRRPAPPRPT